MSGSTAIMSGGTIAATAIVETLNGGIAIVKGVVTNSGTLMASGIGSLLEITGGTVVSGGAVKVGNGIVDVLSGGTADVVFQSNGSGGLDIADTNTTRALLPARCQASAGSIIPTTSSSSTSSRSPRIRP